MGIGTSKIGRSIMGASMAHTPLACNRFAKFSHAVTTSNATTFSNLSKDITLYQADRQSVGQVPQHETAVEVYKRLDCVPKLKNVWDTTPPPQVAVFHETEDVARLLGVPQKYKYAVAQNPNHPDDTKVLLCQDVSEAHKALEAQSLALGYEVVMAGHVTGNPDGQKLCLEGR